MQEQFVPTETWQICETFISSSSSLTQIWFALHARPAENKAMDKVNIQIEVRENGKNRGNILNQSVDQMPCCDQESRNSKTFNKMVKFLIYGV